MAKDRKTVTLDRWLIDAINRIHPGSNFSSKVEAMLRAIIQRPDLYWKHKAKHHKIQFDHAISMRDHFAAMLEERIKLREEAKIRQETEEMIAQ